MYFVYIHFLLHVIFFMLLLNNVDIFPNNLYITRCTFVYKEKSVVVSSVLNHGKDVQLTISKSLLETKDYRGIIYSYGFRRIILRDRIKLSFVLMVCRTCILALNSAVNAGHEIKYITQFKCLFY